MKTKLTLISLALLISVADLLAEPLNRKDWCPPSPVGGMQTLKNNVVYPELARTVRYEGDVILKFKVDRQGGISDVTVVQSGGPEFDKAAIAAVMKTAWQPAQESGQPIKVVYALPFRFRIE